MKVVLSPRNTKLWRVYLMELNKREGSARLCCSGVIRLQAWYCVKVYSFLPQCLNRTNVKQTLQRLCQLWLQQRQLLTPWILPTSLLWNPCRTPLVLSSSSWRVSVSWGQLSQRGNPTPVAAVRTQLLLSLPQECVAVAVVCWQGASGVNAALCTGGAFCWQWQVHWVVPCSHTALAWHCCTSFVNMIPVTSTKSSLQLALVQPWGTLGTGGVLCTICLCFPL